jgi:hypothetical protein
VGDWYANPNKANAWRTQANWVANGHGWECPSFRNSVRYNAYGKGYGPVGLATKLPLVKAIVPEDDPDYANVKFVPFWRFFCPAHRGRRFSTAGNDYIPNWSTMHKIITGWEANGGVITRWRRSRSIY